MQEAFLAVWRHPDGYDAERGSVKSWLMGMVHHRAVDLVRREEAHRRRSDDAITNTSVPEPDPAQQVADQIDLPQERAAVRNALEELPTEQRQVVELMYFDFVTLALMCWCLRRAMRSKTGYTVSTSEPTTT